MYAKVERHGDLVFLAMDGTTASALVGVLNHVSGDPYQCLRGTMDNVRRALEMAHIKSTDAPMKGNVAFIHEGYNPKIVVTREPTCSSK